jgi:hypothetical protein
VLVVAAVVLPLAATVLTLGQIRIFSRVAVSEAFLLALVGIAASVFALIAAIAALIISIATDPLDRQRMMRRYRSNAFDFVATYCLGTIFWIVLAIILLPRASDHSITGPYEWILALFALLLGAVGWLIYYVHRLVTTRPEEKISWLELEIEAGIQSALVSAVANEQLKAILREVTKSRTRLAYDVGMDRNWDPKPDDVHCWPRPSRGGYLNDVSLRRLKSWLNACQLTHAGSACLATVLERRFRPGDALVVLRPSVSAPGFDQKARRLAGACQFVQRNPAGQLELSLKDLRDRAWLSAHEGATGQFESILETFTRLAVRLYSVEATVPPVLLPEERNAYELPSVLLRAAVHELGEEVFQAQSPNTIKAWMHLPQRLLEATRQFPNRRVWAITYPWWRAAQLIRQWGLPGSTQPEKRKLLLDSFEVRLHYYVEELGAIWKEAPPDMGRALAAERTWLLRVLGRFFSVVDETAYPRLEVTLDALIQDTPHPREKRTPWLLCARHMLADYYELPAMVDSSIVAKWENVRKAYSDLRHLIDDYTVLRDSSTERTEHRVYQIYAQSIDLTWEEQWEVGLGRWIPLIKGDPAQDLESVVIMLAVDRPTDASVLRNVRGPARQTLCDLLRRAQVSTITEDFFRNATPKRGALPDAIQTFRVLLGCADPNRAPAQAAAT